MLNFNGLAIALYGNYSLKFPRLFINFTNILYTYISDLKHSRCKSWRDCEMSEKNECCGKTFNTKEELEAHKEKMHNKGCCS